MSDPADKRRVLHAAGYYLFILVISLAVYRAFMQVHEGNLEMLSNAAKGVLTGKPHWIAYQNRLLGPSMVDLIARFGIPFTEALKAFDFLMILAQNLLLGSLLRKTNRAYAFALIWVTVFSIAYMSVQNFWFYTWDSIDVIIFTLFAWGILQSKPTGFFILLFPVALLNRESALFIALYLVIDAFHFGTIRERFYLASWSRLFLGSFLLLFGMAYTKFIRTCLFISQAGGADDIAHAVIGNHFLLSHNLKKLLYYNLFSLDVINSLFIVGSVAGLLSFIRRYNDAQIKALLVYCAMVANILIFGAINETRMYLILFPFVIFMITGIADSRALPGGQQADGQTGP